MLWYTYLYENIMFTNKMRHSIIWKGNAWEAGWVRKVLALIKSLNYAREEEDALEVHLNKIDQSRSKSSADTSYFIWSNFIWSFFIRSYFIWYYFIGHSFIRSYFVTGRNLHYLSNHGSGLFSHLAIKVDKIGGERRS